MPSSLPHAPVRTSSRLADVHYDIRGELSRRARELEAAGRQIVHLNIGNPGRFGFAAPEHLRAAVAAHVALSEAYCPQQGLAAARDAIAERESARGAHNASGANVFIGNGVSELIDMSLRALLDAGDEVLLPSPDYPLWSAAVTLNGGQARYYACPASRGHLPDPDEIEALITPRTRALVVINPNNPTGAVYPQELLAALVQIAQRHRLVLMSDEIYDEIVYDGARFVPLAALAGDVPTLTYCGLSKVHRACGWRVGWVSLSGAHDALIEIHQALDLLASLRLCANVPGQWAIAPALTGPNTSAALTAPGGRLYEARRAIVEHCAQSEFLDVVAPQGSLYAFPSVRAGAFPEFDDHAFALELLETQNVLIVPGRGFNIREANHFRVTLLPQPTQLHEVFRASKIAWRAWPQRASDMWLSVAAGVVLAASVASPAPRWLALGDSYTIGEGVPASDNWPHQLAAALHLSTPEIVARTGWTTDELAAAMAAHAFHPPYALVTLSIGVNNQYRGRDLENYRVEFRALLERAIALAGGDPQRVIVVSIPDWGVTRFGAQSGRDTALIAHQIDAFNAANAQIATALHARYADVTAISRNRGADSAMLVGDGLHPSATMYARWMAAIEPQARAALRAD